MQRETMKMSLAKTKTKTAEETASFYVLQYFTLSVVKPAHVDI
jgi:hypothetical protein